jgi:hypothetical protein
MPAPADVGTLRFPQMSRSEKSVSFVTPQATQPSILFFCFAEQSISLNFKSKIVISRWILFCDRRSPRGAYYDTPPALTALCAPSHSN